MLAQAEFMAAQEETYQNERNTGTDNNPQPITSTFLASALQVARANLVSTSTQTASGKKLYETRSVIKHY